MVTKQLFQFRKPLAIFDLVDRYAQQQSGGQRYPRPSSRLCFRLLRRTAGGQVRTYDPPLKLKICQNPSGYEIFFGQLLWPDNTLIDLQPAGESYLIRIEGPRYLPVERELTLPGAELVHTIDLLPGADYPFPGVRMHGPALLRGVVRDAAGGAVPGAVVKVVGQPNSCISNPDGAWALVFEMEREPADVVIRTHLPDGTARDRTIWIVPGRETQLRTTTLTGTLYGPRGAPLSKVTVSADGLGQTARTDAAGRWALEFPDDQGSAEARLHFARPGDMRSIDTPLWAGYMAEVLQPALRGRALDAAGAGLAGARISIVSRPERATCDSAGNWCCYLPIDHLEEELIVKATAPDGRQLTSDEVETKAQAAVEVPTFQFD